MAEQMVEQEEQEATPQGGEWQPSRQDQAYANALLKAVHSKKTRSKVHEMLGSTYPEVSVPRTVLLINDMVEKKAREGGKPPSLETLLYANSLLINDLIEVGNLAQVWDKPVEEEERVGSILQDTMQKYIQKGLKDGTIDPTFALKDVVQGHPAAFVPSPDRTWWTGGGWLDINGMTHWGLLQFDGQGNLMRLLAAAGRHEPLLGGGRTLLETRSWDQSWRTL